MSPPVAEHGREDSSSTVRFINALRDRWWVIVLCGLICASAAVAYSLTQTKVYTASASLLFRNVQLGDTLFDSQLFTPSTDPTRDAATNIELLTSLKVARRVKSELKLDTPPETLLGNLSVEENDNSDVVGVNYVDESPRAAARIATAFAEQYVVVRREADREVVRDAQDLIRQRLDALPAGATAERASLTSVLEQLTTLEAIQTGNAEVVDVASVPTDPSAPAPKQNAALGLVLGLALGAALAFALDFLDRRVRSTGDFEEGYGLPILTRVPHKAFAGYDPKRQTAASFEPYRMLRNALGALRREGNPLRVLLITSAVPGEGKTLVSVNLARAVALTGRDAAVVETDMRDPDLGKHFPIEPWAAELTTTLVEGTDEGSLQRVSPGRWSDGPELPTGDIVLLPAGTPPPNASEMMSGPAMSGLLEWLSEMNDLVILDAAPLLPVADTHALLDQVPIDGCIIVARAESTTRDQVARTRAIIEQHHGLDVLGVVVTDAHDAHGVGYGFYGLDQELIADDHDVAGEADEEEPAEGPTVVEPAPQGPPAAAPPQMPPPVAQPPQAPPPAPMPPPQAPAPAQPSPQAPPPAYPAPPAPGGYPAPAAPPAYGRQPPPNAYPAPAVPAHGQPWPGNGQPAAPYQGAPPQQR